MHAESLQEAGPLLVGLLGAQRLEEEVVGSAHLLEVADAVVRRARRLGDCVVWPVGAAAERVAGVVTVRANGAVDVGAWNSPVEGRRILLVAVAGVSPLALEAAARHLLSRGADEVHGCGVDVRGGERAIGLHSYEELRPKTSRQRLTLVGDAA